MVKPLRRTVRSFLKRLETELPCDPAIPLLGIYTEKTIIRKDTFTPMFPAALFTIARTWKQPNVHQQRNAPRRSGPRTQWNITLIININ